MRSVCALKPGNESPRHLPQRVEDGALVERARSGDRSAEELLFRRHVRRVGAVVSRLIGAHEDVDDLVHDAFLIALCQLDRLREPQAFGGWVMQIAINRVRQTLRRRKLERALGLVNNDAVLLSEMAQPGLSPEVQVALRQIDKALALALPAQHIAWVLRRVEGYTLDEVAMACDCSLATAKRRIARADKRVEKLASDGSLALLVRGNDV
ncbi:MAG: sigma-70 family RNA polymerase sigma factor [Deltaproteobacteria bacterium]|nr:sigma-70 family RNA polymerase sigma factor [Deltaproteobacteria bacterium]